MVNFVLFATPLWWNLVFFFWIPLLAVVLDVFLRYPQRLPHPVQGIGAIAKRFEQFATQAQTHHFSKGVGCLLLLCCIVAAIVAGLIFAPYLIGCIFALFFSWAGLALGQLLQEGKKSLALIDAAQLASVSNPADEATQEALIAARKSVAMLVSRSTDEATPEDLYRTLAETLSENFNDAFIAPFFWLCVTGPVGLWVYKTVSTLDSLWGYKTEQYIQFGKASARTDDVLAFIPARLAAFFLFATAPLLRLQSNWPGWQQVKMQAALMDSPNAGLPMACAAWLHKARMGGKAIYNGKEVKKPTLGPISGTWDSKKLHNLLRHMLIAGLTGAGCILFAGVLLTSIIMI